MTGKSNRSNIQAPEELTFFDALRQAAATAGGVFPALQAISTASPTRSAATALERILAGFEEIPGQLGQHRAQSNLREFERAGNPLYAMACISDWPDGTALPPVVMAYLKIACSTVVDAAREYAADHSRNFKTEEMNNIVLRAFGVSGGSRKGANAFSAFREQWRACSAAEAYLENCEQNPSMKADEITARMARAAHVSKKEMAERITIGKKLLGFKGRRSEVRRQSR